MVFVGGSGAVLTLSEELYIMKLSLLGLQIPVNQKLKKGFIKGVWGLSS